MSLRRHSVLARLLGYFLLLSLVPLVVLGSVSYWGAVRSLQQETFSRLTTTIVLKEDAINRWIADMKQDTRLLAQTPVVRQYAAPLLTQEEADPQFLFAYETLQDYFATILAEEPDFLEVFLLTDVGGKVVLSTNREHEGEYKVTDTYFVRGREETYVQNVYPSVSLGKSAMTIATPLFDDTDSRIGVLAVHLNLDMMDKILLERTGLGVTGETYLVDQLNVFVSEARFGPERFPRGVHTEGIDAALEGLDGTGLYENYRGVPVVGAYRWMEERELALLAEMAQKEALAPARRLTWIFLLIGLIVAGSVVVAAYGTARQISAPIVTLTRTATRITAGDLEQEAAVLARDEIGVLATAFNSMTAQLRSLITTLEQRVAERTRDLERRSLQLEAAAEVARDATAILDIDRLLDETVRLISDQFGFYHAGVFLVDDSREYAVLRAASSEGGQRMLARGHKLAVGKVGMVGYVTGTGQPRIALDVGEDAVHFANPDLPETRSEMTLPLRVRGETIGALDVQSTEEAAFTEEDVATLGTMADQLAVAIENACLFRETQDRLREIEALYRDYSREAWTRAAPPGRAAAYEYDRVAVSPVQTPRWPGVDEAVQESETVLLAQPGVAESVFVTPLKVRDQVIGALGFHETDKAREWSPDEIALVEAVSSQVALALENARLFEETRTRAEELAVLNELGQALTTRLNVEEVLDAAYRGAARLLDTTNFYIGLYDPERDEVAFLLDTTESETDRHITVLPASLGLTGYIIRKRTSVLIEENVIKRLAEMGVEPVGQPALSWLGVPLIVGDRVLGVMAMQSYTTPRAYNEHDRDLLTAIASQTAIALQNAYLFEEAQRRARHERLVREITAKIRGSVDLDAMLQTAVQELGKVIGSSRAYVELGTEAELSS